MGSHSLRPDGLLALHRPGRLHSSFHLLSRLSKTSNMTTRVDSQFPRPVFHRRDTQPYGLRTKITKHSRVGWGDEPHPLIEPDMQVSSIRLTDTRRRKSTQAVDGVVVTET
jgi:hypothetical protein